MKIVLFTDVWVAGGISKYISDITTKIDINAFSCVVLTTQVKTSMFLDEIEKNCGCVQVLSEKAYDDPIKRVISGLLSFENAMKDIKPDVLHIHASNGTMFLYAYLAKKAGVKNVIVHSHNTDFGDGHRIIKRIGHEGGKYIFQKYADERIACSRMASEWLFTKKNQKNVKIIKCFVDTDRFQFNEMDRRIIRKMYDIDESTIIYLNVGRFNYQKNQLFLLDVFKKIIQKQEAYLFMIGEGELQEAILKKIKDNNIENRVIIVGTTPKVEQYMSAADIFILPSLFEGNPITSIEAQASGLECFLSDTITNEAKIIDDLHYIDIRNVSGCADSILNKPARKRNRLEYAGIVRRSGYDVELQVDELARIYMAGI